MEENRTARRIAEWNPQWKSRRGTWEDAIRIVRQKKKPFDREFWRENSCLGVEANCILTEKFL
jgi:hypothetical protein